MDEEERVLIEATRHRVINEDPVSHQRGKFKSGKGGIRHYASAENRVVGTPQSRIPRWRRVGGERPC